MTRQYCLKAICPSSGICGHLSYLVLTIYLFFQVNSNQWEMVHEQQWPKNSIVALIEWLPNLTKTTMPTMLRKQILRQKSNVELYQPIDVTSSDLSSMDETQLEQMVQWSDLIIFDYLTGNYDRMASMQVISFLSYLSSFMALRL